MKAKLVACMLGMSIIITTGTVVPAETDEVSAGFAVENTAEPQPAAEPAAPAPETNTENTGVPDNSSQESAADTGSNPNPAEDNSQEPIPEETAGSGSTDGGSESLPGEAVNSDGSVTENVSSGSSVSSSSGIVPEGSSADASDSSVSEKSEESASSDSLEAGSEEEEEEDEDEEKELIVVGFKGVGRIVLKEKKPLKEVLAMLPSVVEAVLSDGATIHVPVDWACTSDYGDEKAVKFVFASSLKKNADGTVYDIGHPLAPGVTFPRAEVVIGEEKEEDKESKNDRKEPTDNKVEDAPLVMDDVTAANISAAEGEEEIFTYLIRELKLNKAAACGVLANIHYESGFNPHAIGDGGTSYGICQWHLGRYFSLVDYCERIHLPYGSVEGQMKYLEYELTGGYAGVLEYLRQVPETEIGAYEAGYYWCYHYEMPAQILRQSTLRGNAAKNSYWPRYQDFDAADSGKEKLDQEKLLLKERRLFENADADAEASAADREEAAPVYRKAEISSATPETALQKKEMPQEKETAAVKQDKETDEVKKEEEAAEVKQEKEEAEEAESAVQKEAERIPEEPAQEEHTWEVLVAVPVEDSSRYFLPVQREDEGDSTVLYFDY